MAAQLHHYVPQFHVRQWSGSDRDSIGVLAKNDRRIFQANPRDVGGEKSFHSKLPEAQVVETRFSQLEAGTSAIYKKIHETLDLKALSDHERFGLCRFVASALVRTREAREEVIQISEALLNEIASRIGVTDWVARLTEDGALGYHLNTFKDIPQHTLHILRLRMVLEVNRTDLPLTTSDHPVVRHNDFPLRPQGGGRLGLLSPGIQLHMPISPKLCLRFLDPDVYGSVPLKMNLVDAQKIVFERRLQLDQSYRHVFSVLTDRFERELSILKENPDIADLKRKRIELDSERRASDDRGAVRLHGYRKERR